MKKSCCTKETCRHNQNQDNSSQISDSPGNTETANKGTQMTPNEMSSMSTEKTSMPAPSSEYDVFYDCLNEKHKHPKLDMEPVYESMENPELFRGTLMQVTILTQQLLKYFEQPPSLAPSKCKLLKNERNVRNKANKCHSSDQEMEPHPPSSEHKCDKPHEIKSYTGPLPSSSSSTESVQVQIPLELHLQSLYDKFKPRDFSNCTDPLCTDIAKAAEPYMKVAANDGKEPATSQETPMKESSSKYYSCQSKDDQCPLPNPNSKYTQTTPVPVFDVGFMPPCWCSLNDTQKLELLNKCPSANYQMSCAPLADESYIPPCMCSTDAESKPDLLCECGLKPDKCICDILEEVKLESPQVDDITNPPTPPISEHSDEDENGKPCDCGHEKMSLNELEEPTKKSSPASQKSLECKEELICKCDLKKPLPPPKPPRKIYRMVYPQHKDLDVCVKCRFEPSPLMDEDGNVICPGNCGCCLCPWKTRASYSVEDVLKHSKIKVCKCRNRGTIFTEITKIDSACSQSSYFDVCPCREKAEEKYIQLYGTDMAKQIWEGEEVLLRDVKELMPAKEGSKRFLTSTLYYETKAK